MPDLKFLTENLWKNTSVKFKIKEPNLQKALCEYEGLEDEAHDDILECVAKIRKHALELKKSKEAAQNAPLAKYLADMISAAEAEQREVAKDKAQAEKQDAAEKKAAEQAKKDSEEGDEGDEADEEEGEFKDKLLTTLRKLKGAPDAVYQFIVCDAKPQPAVMVAKRITPQHRQDLTDLTESKRFLHVGECRFENGFYVFTMENPVSGLARKLQASLKFYTGKKQPVKVGTEEAGMDEPEGNNAPNTTGESPSVTAAKTARPDLGKAPEVWNQTRGEIEATIKQLKDAVRKAFADQAPEIIAEIESNMVKLDAVLDKLDQRLADSLAKAHAAQDPGARKTELAQSKTILADYIKYVKSEPMIGHIDTNPFGVSTNLKQKLSSKLMEMAQAIG